VAFFLKLDVSSPLRERGSGPGGSEAAVLVIAGDVFVDAQLRYSAQLMECARRGGHIPALGLLVGGCDDVAYSSL